MRRLALIVLLVACGANAFAQEEPFTTVVVPVVGSILGMNNVRWHTDVELVNDLGREATVALELPTTDAGPIILPLAPGQTQRFTNIVGEAFGLEAALSPLLITTAARRSVTVRATVYGVINGSELSAPQPIALNYGAGYYATRLLDGLAFSDDQRTNVGLVNLGEEAAEFVIALQRFSGRNVAVTRLRVPPHAMFHVPVQVLFPLITKGDNFNVLVETGAAETYVYASVIDNHSSAARFIQPRLGGQ